METEREKGVESMDRDERIQSRRSRVEQRQSMRKDQTHNKESSELESKKVSQSQQQIANSLNQLDRRKLKGIEQVTNVRVQSDGNENLHRIQEEERRANRIKMLQEESILSGRRNAAVEMRWSELLDYNMPQELHNEMCAQKEACSTIMSSKDAIIKEFHQQLKDKDEEYVRALKQQAEDIETLLERMMQQYKEIQEEYEVELDQIEDVFMKERDELLAGNKAEIDSLFEKRRAMEIAYMDAKQARDEKYRKEIQELRLKDAEDYSKLKIKLETDIQTLEQQLEEMRATYQLNTEKLEYNYRVLTERDMENSATLSQQKRRLARLKDSLSALIQKYAQTDARDRHQNQELTDEYRRITKQYRDLQAKFRHFQEADHQRYESVWKMHAEEADEMLTQLLKADKIIHEQQLGLKWIAPTEKAVKGKAASSLDKPETDGVLVHEEGLSMASNLGGENSEESSTQLNKPRISSAQLKLMLKMLSAEAGFLVDSRVRDAINSLSESEAELAQADSILRSLHVGSESEMARLLSYFFHSSAEDETTTRLKFGDRDEKASDAWMHELGLKIQPDDVIATIRLFVEEINETRRSESDGLSAQRASAVAPHAATTTFNDADDLDLRQARRKKTDKEFWRKVSTVIPPKSANVWTYLEKGLIKYHDVLHKRSESVKEVEMLHQQNAELKALLKQYLNAKVNDDLIIPPTQTIRVQSSTRDE